MNDPETLLKQVFGESDDSDADDCEQRRHENESESKFGRSLSWLRIKEINGLYLCREFLSPQHQSSLLCAIQNEGWFTDASHNQGPYCLVDKIDCRISGTGGINQPAMRFGDLPTWATKLSNSIRDLASCDVDKEVCLLPSDLLWREPLFDQLIVNVYQPGEGICAHVDLMRFEDGIAIVSLESSCVMHFTRVVEASATGEGGTEDPPAAKVPVYLPPGSLVVMSGEARYLWKHEITRKPGFQMWEGKELNQKRRISITLRKLCHIE